MVGPRSPKPTTRVRFLPPVHKMARLESFELFCPKAEQKVGKFFINLDALAAGEKDPFTCPFAHTEIEEEQNVNSLQFVDVVRVEKSRTLEQFDVVDFIRPVSTQEKIIVEGNVNQATGKLDVRFTCGHCGNQGNLSFKM